MKKYRVVAICRNDGKRVRCVDDVDFDSAVATFNILTVNRPMFMSDFKVRIELLEPIVVMESK